MQTQGNSDKTVLVTGGTGFIAVHCILQLLQAGYQVRTTVRSLGREETVRAMLREGGVEAGSRLTLVKADLDTDTNWDVAVNGCTYVIHVASPTPKLDFKHEDEMIIPAREGVLRVLRAAKDASVKRVVLTSAMGAIVYGHPEQSAPFDETTWTNLAVNVPAYQKSKTLAEMAAWDFIKKEGKGMELTAINPAGVMGPVLGPDYSHSIYIIKNMLTGKVPGCPKISASFVDVRDVAGLHLRAMTDPAAAGQRFIASAGHSIWMVEVARILKKNLGTAADKVKARELPNFVVKLVGLTDPTVKATLPLLGKDFNVTSAKAIKLLGWQPRSAEEAITATAESLIRLNLLDK